MWIMLSVRKRKAYLIVIILIIGYIVLSAVCANLYSNLKDCELSQPIKFSSSVHYCDGPKKLDCKEYIEDIEGWIKSSSHWESQFLQCNLDLSRCQNELNADIICIEPECI